ncbi:hypothetical protein HYS95_00990 [Candidatus Daviesbacteria bacterium]|nr:hypothetical protein [Candidatus Daviesbacteria bacterium]
MAVEDPILKLADEARRAVAPSGENVFKRGLNKLGNLAGGVGRKAGGALGGVGNAAGGARDMAGNMVGGVGHGLGAGARAVGDGTVGVLGGVAHLGIEGAKLPFKGAGKGVELAKKLGTEAVIGKAGDVLKNVPAFGKSIAGFATGKIGEVGAGMASRELAKGVLAWTATTAGIGTGITGTWVGGAFVGAMGGAMIEWGRQINQNLKESDPSIAGRRAAFLLKFKELRHAGVLKPRDLKKIRNAAIFGAIAGAGAGALVQFVPEIAQFVGEHSGFLTGTGDTAGAAAGTTADALGGVGGSIGNAAGGIGEGIGGVWSGTGEAIGGIAGGAGEMTQGVRDMAGNLPGVKGTGDVLGGIGNAAGNVWSGTGEVAGGALARTGETIGGATQTTGDFARSLPMGQGAADTLGGVGGAIGGGLGQAGEAIGNAAQAVGLGGAQEAAQQAGQETAQGAAEQAAGEAGNTGLSETVQAAADEANSTAALDASNAAVGEAVQQTGQETVQQVGQEALEEAGQEVAQGTEPIANTMVHGHEVAGSVVDQSLTYDGAPWVLLENGTKNIGNVLEAAGIDGALEAVDKGVLAQNLQQATNLWTQGQLTPSAYPDLYTLFHLSNGTASVYNDLLNEDTVDILKKLKVLK